MTNSTVLENRSAYTCLLPDQNSYKVADELMANFLLNRIKASKKPIVEKYIQPSFNFTSGQETASYLDYFQVQLGSPVAGLFWNQSTTGSNWVESVSRLSTKGKYEAAVKEIAITTMKVKASGEYMRLSEEINSFKHVSLPDIVLVALLRSTFSIRSKIPTWTELLDATEKILISRERNCAQLLRGLRQPC